VGGLADLYASSIGRVRSVERVRYGNFILPNGNALGVNAIKLRNIFIFSTWNRMALSPSYGTKVTVSKSRQILNLMVLVSLNPALIFPKILLYSKNYLNLDKIYYL